MSTQGVTMEQATELLAHRICKEQGIHARVSEGGDWMFPRWVVDQAMERVDRGMNDGTIWDTLAESILITDPTAGGAA